jgi:hypothetical protein
MVALVEPAKASGDAYGDDPPRRELVMRIKTNVSDSVKESIATPHQKGQEPKAPSFPIGRLEGCNYSTHA